eukprot:2904084-Rhodomonas_salina.1
MQTPSTLPCGWKKRTFCSLTSVIPRRMKAGFGVARKCFRVGAPLKDVDALAKMKKDTDVITGSSPRGKEQLDATGSSREARANARNARAQAHCREEGESQSGEARG